MQYILLLRGVNVGGKNKVVMSELKDQLAELGYVGILTYLNSGNILFHSKKNIDGVKREITDILSENYEFNILFSLLTAKDFQLEVEKLPDWWSEPIARRDALFFTDECNRTEIMKSLERMPLGDEIIHIGEKAVFWGKYNEKEFLKTAYHKLLIKEPFYKQITIRSGNTFSKILSLLEKNKDWD